MTEAYTFEGLVREAFIKPLRSVLIVDDQYPTWEEIFNSKIKGRDHSIDTETKSLNKAWQDSSTAGEVQKLIREFRCRKPGFIIDIHDGVSIDAEAGIAGSETPKELADHLYQSDLLILDYNLEGSDAGTGGDTARKILASVLDNQHFNLVVVHTNENLDDVMHQCLMALMQSCTSQYDKKCIAEIAALEDEKIIKCEDGGDFKREDVQDKIGLNTYIELRHPNNSLRESLGLFMRGEGAFVDLHAWADQLGLTKSQKKTFFYWSIRAFEKRYLAAFTTTPPRGLSWHISDSCKWLRTSRGFVCFVKKDPPSLLSELENALISWQPTPSRLLSAKYRYEISRMGAEIEDTSLSQKYAFAKFYDIICNPGMSELPEEQTELLRRYKLRDHVSRQSEMLSFLVEEGVADFGQKIYEADKQSGLEFKRHYGVDLNLKGDKKIAIGQYNRHICCLPSRKDVTGQQETEQLDSGHIFKLDGDWWVCATPACDLQPGQNTIAFKKRSSPELRPFTALKLEKVPNLDSLSENHINSGSYCYIEHEGKILGLGVNSPNNDSTNPAVQKVTWRAFIANKGGMIKDGKLSIFELELELEDMKIKSGHKEAEIVAKLRYEYALNYIQRVGTSVSRIGLGYVSN